MEKRLSRREILKLAGLLPLAYYLPKALADTDRQKSQKSSDTKNVLLIVFDALSARNISFHGYERETTPNLTRLLGKASVYHNHYSASNYTYPGTASILTGTYPWTNRGFSPHEGIMEEFSEKNIFQEFNQHNRICYTHNPVAQSLIEEFEKDIDYFKRRQDLFLDQDIVSGVLFQNDEDLANLTWSQAILKGKGSTYSLFLSHMYEGYRQGKIEQFAEIYPRGIPNIRDDNFFLLEDAIDWTQIQLKKISQPFMGYFHYLPPHDPYFTRSDFMDVFKNDGFKPINKPEHLFSTGRSYNELKEAQTWYDEFILFTDAEFGRLYNNLERAGLLENTILVFTSDHGEMFERGIAKHYHESLHQPVIQVPLIIIDPEHKTRQDIYSPTSAIDLLPTLLHLTNQDIPDWCEGRILPPFDSSPSPDHSVFALEAKKNKKNQIISPGSAMIVKGEHKLTYYFDYKQLKGNKPLIELYNIINDPEEMNNLYLTEENIANTLLDELLAKIHTADAPYSN